MQGSFSFDAVLFDLDGTLVATDRFWVQAARTGARRAFVDLGLERVIPGAEDWMGLVGQPLDEGFARLFGDLEPDQRKHVQALCVEEEHRLLDRGGAAWMPGGESLLEELVARGVHIGVASNCSQAYLEHMLNVLGIGRFASQARCLDSPRTGNKGDMIESLLETFDTRSAVFVGDRVGDRNSAWANAIPHVHCSFGFAGHDEGIEAQAQIEDLGELIPKLSGRDAWIEAALGQVGLMEGPSGRSMTVGVTGLPLAGKSLFARDAARLLRARGIPAAVCELSAWLDPGRAIEPPNPLSGLDLEALETQLLAPVRGGEKLCLTRTYLDFRGLERSSDVVLDAEGVLFLVGEGLLDPSLKDRLGRTLWLEIDARETLRRAKGREGRALGVQPLEALKAGRLAAASSHRQHYDPGRLADLVLPAGNPLGA